jgi:hypothetical protein
LFFYILWPQQDLAAEVPVPWYATQPIRVTGPIVLFGISAGLLFHFMPPREQFGTIYELQGNAEPISFQPDTKLQIEGRRGERLSYHLIPGDDIESDTLKMVFIQFPSGEDQITFVFKHPSYRELRMTLSRSDTALDLSRLKKRGVQED